MSVGAFLLTQRTRELVSQQNIAKLIDGLSKGGVIASISTFPVDCPSQCVSLRISKNGEKEERNGRPSDCFNGAPDAPRRIWSTLCRVGSPCRQRLRGDGGGAFTARSAARARQRYHAALQDRVGEQECYRG